MTSALSGVFAAAVTPLREDFSPASQQMPLLLDFLAGRGCHGSLLLGTTGEGPSFSQAERLEIFRQALRIRESWPEFRLLAGVGTPSLDETIQLTRAAFELGMDGVVCLPPYYFRGASQEGLFEWFKLVLEKAVPTGGAFFGYHIPPVTGVPLSLELLERLKNRFPDKFAGIKDSSADPLYAVKLGECFGKDLTIFTGNDALLSHALQNHAAGCITAPANLLSPVLRRIWDDFQGGNPNTRAQEWLNEKRRLLDQYPPAPALLKYLLHHSFDLPDWPVRPPLLPLPKNTQQQAAAIDLGWSD